MKPIVRISAAGSIFGWDIKYFNQYVEYLKYPPSIIRNINWKHDIRLIEFNNIPHL